MTCHQSHNLKKKKKKKRGLQQGIFFISKAKKIQARSLPLAHAHELFGISP
jgi:hypothetical protein